VLSIPPNGLNLHIVRPPGSPPPTVLQTSSGIKFLDGGSVAPLGYLPTDIQTAYRFNNVKVNGIVGDGSGQTIAIPDAYDDPSFKNSTDPGFKSSDLAQFDLETGLPDPPSFTKYNQLGQTTNLPGTDPAGAGNLAGNWEYEIALDIEWSHAVAPKANIALVEANSEGNDDLLTAVQTAAKLPGVCAVSMSWGDFEKNFANIPNIDKTVFTTPAGHQGVTFLAASGDSGSPGYYPAYSSNVVAVGGSTLQLNSDSTYQSETAWSGSGGGTSQYEPEPGYQQQVQNTQFRTIPDVAMDADPNTGVGIYDSYNDTDGSGPWLQIGGTSLACPVWAGLIAITDQLRVATGGSTLDGPTQTLPFLYELPPSAFHDITEGSNGGFKAGPGYDQVTGLGTPKADVLVPDLVSYATASKMVVIAQPPKQAILGDSFAIAVAAVDNAGHIDGTYKGTGSVALNANSTGANLGGTLTTTFNRGIAVFDGLTLDKLGSGYTFTLSDTDFNSISTGSMSVINDPTPWQKTFYPAPTDASLRAAVTAAESDADAYNTIVLGDASYILSDLSAGNIVIQNSSSLPSKTLTIVGDGSTNSFIKPGTRSWNDRLFEILGTNAAATNVVFQDLTIEGGRARNGGVFGGTTALGGGLLINGANVTLQGVALADNEALGAPGAQGSASAGTGAGKDGGNGTKAMDARGGGIFLASGNLTLVQDVFSQNVAHGGVGGGGGAGGSGLHIGDYTKDVPGGFGGNGGTGGQGAGGALFMAGGSVRADRVSFTGNQAVGGAGGVGGTGGQGGVDKHGGSAGNGGLGGPSYGGAIYLAHGIVNVTSSTLQGNGAIGGAGGQGGLGGNGGSALLGGTGSVLGGSGGFARHFASGSHPHAGSKIGADGGDGGSGGAGSNGSGGGLYVNGGSLTVLDSTVKGNQATGGLGGLGLEGGYGAIGALPTFGTNLSKTIPASGVSGGYGGNGGDGGSGFGGGFVVAQGAVTIESSTISSNVAQGGDGGAGGTGGPGALVGELGIGGTGTATSGGAPPPHTGGAGGDGGTAHDGTGGGFYVSGGTLNLVNATVASNSAQAGAAGTGGAGGSGGTDGHIKGDPGSPGDPGDASAGGMFVSVGTVNLFNSTVALNTLVNNINGTGDGVIQSSGTVSATSTLFAANGTDDYEGNITANNSLFQTAPTGGSITGSGDLTGDDPLLDPAGLAVNGGPTLTIALQSGSPAYGMGSNPEDLFSDQRGASPRSGPGGTDIGAYQHDASADTQAPKVSLQAPAVTTANASALNPYTFSLTFSDAQAVAAASLPGAQLSVVPPGGGPPIAATPIGTTPKGSADALGDASSFTVAYRIAPPGGAWSPSDNGVYTIVLGGAEVADLAGNDTSSGAIGTFNVQVSSDHLFFSSNPPSAVTAGGWFGATVQVLNGANQVDTTYSGNVKLSLGQDPGNTTLGGNVSVAVANGVATFSYLMIKVAGAGYTLQATAPGLVAIPSSAFTVNPSWATTLTLSPIASPVTAGSPISLTITAYDSFGNVATGYTGTLHFTSTDSKLVASDYNFTSTDAGTKQLSVTFETAGTQAVRARDTVHPTITAVDAGVIVAPAVTSTLTVAGFPATTAGVAHSFTVTARDAYGNVTPGYTGTVHFTSTDPKASLPADYPFQASDHGVHTFVATLKTVPTQSITATDTNTSSIQATEIAIAVKPAAAATFVVAFPASTTAGQVQNLLVTAYDAYGNVATSYASSVHFTSNDPRAGLPSTYVFTSTDAGQHTFTAALKTAGLYAIRVTDTAHASVTGVESGIQVTAAAPNHIGVSGYPTSTTRGTQNNFVVTIYDAYSNIVTWYTGTLQFSSNDPLALLPADTTFSASNAGQITLHATFQTDGTFYLGANDKANKNINGQEKGIVVTG
jgi:hypothetical protein